MAKQTELRKYIEIRPIKLEDYLTVLKWRQDDYFCEANGWEKNRSRGEIHSWWNHCVDSVSTEFIRLGIELNDKLIG